MNLRLQKEVLIGGAAGVLVLVLTWILTGGKRDDLLGLKTTNAGLEIEVAKGYALKANYERLKVEVAQQEKVIEELVKIMSTDADRGDIPYQVKKLADMAGVEQVSFSLLAPIKKDYYTEYPVQFSFRAGYHGFGQFSSLASGFGKIINVNDMQMKREAGNPYYPMTVACRVSAFVYDPAQPLLPAAPPKSAAPVASPKKEAGD
jgi:Tfp pilus assembly protein PilO